MLFKFFNDVLFDCILNYFVVGCCKYSVWKHASNTGGPWMTTTQVTYPKKMYATEKQHGAKPQRILFIKDIIINFYFPLGTTAFGMCHIGTPSTVQGAFFLDFFVNILSDGS